MVNIYVINLKRCADRKEYMASLLSKYDADIVFIDAVDGALLSEEEKNQLYDIDAAYKKYGKTVTNSEIGCAVSHQKCYKHMIDNNIDEALIFEDDVYIIDEEKDTALIDSVQEFLHKQKKPSVVLLSGDYWYFSKKKLNESHEIANVYDGVSAQAYYINNSAAQALYSNKPGFIADDWMYLKKFINLYAVFPHMFDQNRIYFKHEVISHMGIVKKNLSVWMRLAYLWNSLMKRVLFYMKHFERRAFKFK